MNKIEYNALKFRKRQIIDEFNAAEGKKIDRKLFDEYEEVCDQISEYEHCTDDKIGVFLSYVHDNFPEPMSNSFTRDLVENVVRYAYKEKGQTSWAAKMMIVDLLPEINYEEVEDLLPKFGFREETK